MRAALAVAATVAAAFLMVGCGIAILFELQGFGRPRDTDPRLGYITLLALGSVACAAIPAWLWRRAAHR